MGTERVYIRSGGATWPASAWLASRVAALTLPCGPQAAAEIAAVVWLLFQDAGGAVAVEEDAA